MKEKTVMINEMIKYQTDAEAVGASAEIERVKMFSEKIAKVKEELARDVVGQSGIIDSVIMAIVAGGNILLEGIPGVGKTRLVRSLGRVLSLPFSRIQ